MSHHSLEAALFPSLMGRARWDALPQAVRELHGGRSVDAKGISAVTGDNAFGARVLRRVFRLPAPGSSAALYFQLEVLTGVERWTRFFATRCMRSRLDPSPLAPGLLRERLGPLSLHFELLPIVDGIHWQLRSLRVLGLPMPRNWLVGIMASSSEREGRYHFHTAVKLPWVGLIVAYEGWLERVD